MLVLGILFDLLTFPVMGPIKAITFISKQIQKQVDEEAFSPKMVEHELLELQMRHEIGEIGEEEFQKEETKLLDRLDELMLAKGVLQDVIASSPSEAGPRNDIKKQKTEREIPIPKAT